MVAWVTVTLENGCDHRVEENLTLATVPVRGFVQTKSFDDGRPEWLKRICTVYPESETDCAWTWITDRGEHPDNTAYGGAIPTAYLPPTTRVAARAEFDGVFSLTGLTVVYQRLRDRKG